MKPVGCWVPEDAPSSQNLFVYMLEHPSRQEAENSYISSVLKRCRSRVVSYVRIDSKRRDFQRSLRKFQMDETTLRKKIA